MENLRTHLPASLLTLALTLLLMSCSDSATDPTDSSNNNTNAEQITADYYIQATLNGQVRTVQQKNDYPDLVDMGFSAYEGSASNDIDYLAIHRTFFSRVVPTGGIPILDTTSTFFFSFIRIYDERIYDDEDYDLMIRKGTMAFGSEAAEKDGIEIRWVDANGKSWSTAYSSGKQENGSVVITEKTLLEYPQPWLGPRYLYDIKGTFTCTLYDGSGNSINVTNGKFSLKAILA